MRITPVSIPAPVERLRAALARAGQLLEVRGTPPAQVYAITDDSRKVGAQSCFVAVRGSARDGHGFLPGIAAAGGALVICEDAAGTDLPAFVVRDGRIAAAVAAAAFYDEPARDLRFIGVTGTNGKTTTVGILRHLLDDPQAPAASIGTLGVLIGSEGRTLPGGQGLTTPGPIELQRVLRQLRDGGVRTVAMEVSSHALHQRRVLGVRFDAAVFTNLTRDHLDYHGTMEAYFEAKALLVGLLTAQGTAVVNADDATWQGLPAAPRRLRFAAGGAEAEVRASDITFSPRGSHWRLETPQGTAEVRLPLIGEFNVSNALGAAAAAIALGVSPAQVAERLAAMHQVPGRLELLSEQPTVLRDYAHTPDALERALVAMRPFTPGRLLVVFGCGGDRDRGKRPLMAQVAQAHADRVIVTSDNPRTEDPERILDDICAPLPPGTYDRIEDRRTAIAHAIDLADRARDVVLLAGKGHETYQIRGTTTLPFDEKAIVHDLLKAQRVGGAHG
ncbi:MAG: UDP-N-acetylmuramoyl-L-alanyl-D-glutamate--2,6-diaminopimelate ligase [Gemmatimonadaceae bacterium]|nr:UDP-N-acetylmuramoyl-L-alanyl-D-glutamate--2,6-diaminopimelate ligase [Gemmatimonadaceae bacterium]